MSRIAIACLVLGVGAGYLLGLSRGTAATMRVLDAAGACASRFDELAIETVRCARIVGISKPDGNRRRELPIMAEMVQGAAR
jgi:hypothetical protein